MIFNQLRYIAEKSFLAFCFVFILTACSVEEAEVPAESYFDIGEFMQAEIQKLNNQNPYIQKAIRLNEETESQRIQITNWENELHIFTEANINRPAYYGAYKTDTIHINDRSFSVQYTAKKADLNTREMIVYQTKNADHYRLDSLYVFTNAENMLYTTRQKMWYYPGQGYNLTGFQQIRLLSPKDIYIEVLFE